MSLDFIFIVRYIPYDWLLRHNRFWSVGLNRLRRIKIGGFFRKIALRRDPANLVVIVVAFVRICEDHSTDRHYVAIFKGYLFGNIYWSVLLVFSSLLVSAVMFHASVSEQTPDTPVSLAV